MDLSRVRWLLAELREREAHGERLPVVWEGIAQEAPDLVVEIERLLRLEQGVRDLLYSYHPQDGNSPLNDAYRNLLKDLGALADDCDVERL